MKICYVAGCYTGSTTYEVRNNIRKAEAVSEWCWKNGIVAICPHLNSAFMDGMCHYKVWAEGYKELIRRCDFDFLVLVPGFEKSDGTKGEIEVAEDKKLPIYKYGDAFGSLYTMDNKYVDLKELLAE